MLLLILLIHAMHVSKNIIDGVLSRRHSLDDIDRAVRRLYESSMTPTFLHQ